MFFSLASAASCDIGGIDKYGFTPIPLSFPSYGLGGLDNSSLVPLSQGCLDPPDSTYLPLSLPNSWSSLDTFPRTPTSAPDPSFADLGSEKQERVPRPRNAFIIFRSQFASQYKACQAHPHQNLVSRNAAEVWNAFSEEEKLPYKLQADEEKREHRRKYPNYIYMSGSRARRGSQASARRSSKPYFPPPSKTADKGTKARGLSDASVCNAVVSSEAQYLSVSANIIPSDQVLPLSSLANVAGEDQTTLSDPCGRIDSQFGFRPEVHYTALPPMPENSLDQALALPTEGNIMFNASDCQSFDGNSCYTTQLFNMLYHIPMFEPDTAASDGNFAYSS
ncbi:hypothetical protein APHAL10511_003439 [Amanita phalloides]|nr:hypothetical protein APHAL10511_003439 [Amanita phalloides]